MRGRGWKCKDSLPSVDVAAKHLFPFGHTLALHSCSNPSGSECLKSSVSGCERRFFAHALNFGLKAFRLLLEMTGEVGPAPGERGGATTGREVGTASESESEPSPERERSSIKSSSRKEDRAASMAWVRRYKMRGR